MRKFYTLLIFSSIISIISLKAQEVDFNKNSIADSTNHLKVYAVGNSFNTSDKLFLSDKNDSKLLVNGLTFLSVDSSTFDNYNWIIFNDINDSLYYILSEKNNIKIVSDEKYAIISKDIYYNISLIKVDKTKKLPSNKFRHLRNYIFFDVDSTVVVENDFPIADFYYTNNIIGIFIEKNCIDANKQE
jgi:hypothetical protein